VNSSIVSERIAYLDETSVKLQRNIRLDLKDREVFARNLGRFYTRIQQKEHLSWASILREALGEKAAESLGKKRKTIALLPGERPNSSGLRQVPYDYFKVARVMAELSAETNLTHEELSRVATAKLIEGSSFDSALSVDQRLEDEYLNDLKSVFDRILDNISKQVDLQWIRAVSNYGPLSDAEGNTYSLDVFDDYPDDVAIASIELGYVHGTIAESFSYIPKDDFVIEDDADIRAQILDIMIEDESLGLKIDDEILLDNKGIVEEKLEGLRGKGTHSNSLNDSETIYERRSIHLELRFDMTDQSWKLVFRNNKNRAPDELYSDWSDRSLCFVSDIYSHEYDFPVPVARILARDNREILSGWNDCNIYLVSPSWVNDVFWDAKPLESGKDLFESENPVSEMSISRVQGYPGFNEALAQKLEGSRYMTSLDAQMATSAPRGSLADFILRNVTTADEEHRIDNLLSRKAKETFDYLKGQKRMDQSKFRGLLSEFLEEGE